mgnify:CR=1 FL=1
MNNVRSTELIVALDVASLDEAVALTRALKPATEWFKIGKELFTKYGPQAVERIRGEDVNVFLDLKYMDIPNTVERGVRAAAALGAKMTTVHASAGPKALQSAASAAQDTGVMVVGVTVLTSMDEHELKAIGVGDPPAVQVDRLARLARDQGLTGVVCSPDEIERVRRICGGGFVLVVPGIRPAGSQPNDQKRARTPREAVCMGADYIVVGRPVTAAQDPYQAARRIMDEMSRSE